MSFIKITIIILIIQVALLTACKKPKSNKILDRLVVQQIQSPTTNNLAITELIIEEQFIITRGYLLHEIIWKDTELTWEIDGTSEPSFSPKPNPNGLRSHSQHLPLNVIPKEVAIEFVLQGKELKLVAEIISDPATEST